MKIILSAKCVHPFHPFGGVQKYVYYFARALVDAGVEVEVVSPRDKGNCRKEERDGITFNLIEPDIYWYLEYPIGWWGVHQFSKNLSAYLQGQEFDLLHSFDLTGFQYAKLKDRRPVISQVFTDNFLSNPLSLWNINDVMGLFGKSTTGIKKEKLFLSPFAESREVWKYPLQYYGKTRPIYECLSECDRIFFEDEDYLGQVSRAYRLPVEKCGVLPVGTDVDGVEQKIRQSPVERIHLGFDLHDKVLLTVNRLAADKGIDQMIKALAVIRQQDPGMKLIIIGAGYQEEELLSLIRNLNLNDHIKLLKDVPEDLLYGYYDVADLYLCAFSYPGSSVSSIEAMAAGLPIITTAQPWLVEDGANGQYISDNRPETIAAAVEKFFSLDDFNQRGMISRQLAERYDWRNIARQAITNYEQLLAGRTRQPASAIVSL